MGSTVEVANDEKYSEPLPWERDEKGDVVRYRMTDDVATAALDSLPRTAVVLTVSTQLEYLMPVVCDVAPQLSGDVEGLVTLKRTVMPHFARRSERRVTPATAKDDRTHRTTHPCPQDDPHTQIAAGLEQLVILTRVTLGDLYSRKSMVSDPPADPTARKPTRSYRPRRSCLARR